MGDRRDCPGPRPVRAARTVRAHARGARDHRPETRGRRSGHDPGRLLPTHRKDAAVTLRGIMSEERKPLTAERILKLNFEHHAKDAAKCIALAIDHLSMAERYGTREGSHARL